VKTGTLCIAAALFAHSLHAQNIAGAWQGIITFDGNPYRTVLQITKAGTGWAASGFSLDEAERATATSVAVQHGHLTVTFPPHGLSEGVATYEGQLGADHRSIVGTWIQAEGRFPLNLRLSTAKDAWALPPANFIRFVAVDSNVKLEVLDWGGSGRALVFLAGLGNTAHDFGGFAPKFSPTYHVYAITRRGFGASSAPAFTTATYTADRLGDDVLAVMDSLGIRRPVLVGHSIGGEELSSIGSRHPDKVAGLIYLDAAYGYAFYDPSHGDLNLDGLDVAHALEQLQPGRLAGPDFRTQLNTLRDTLLPRLERAVAQRARAVDAMPASMLNAQQADTAASASRAVIAGEEKYTSIPVPVLAIFAVPHRPDPRPNIDSASRAWIQAQGDSFAAGAATAFQAGVPSAHVVRIPNSTHFVYRSNEAETLREMNAFLTALPPVDR
jgi:non-heme chloroperoxidase